MLCAFALRLLESGGAVFWMQEEEQSVCDDIIFVFRHDQTNPWISHQSGAKTRNWKKKKRPSFRQT
jgi:hypothetical protein